MRVMVVAAAAMAVSAATAGAGEIDFTRPIRDLSGNVVVDPAAKDGRALDLLTVATSGLLAAPPGSAEGLDAKTKRFELALAIFTKKRLALRSEEITVVKNAIAGVYGPLVVGRAVELLEQSPGEVRGAP